MNTKATVTERNAAGAQARMRAIIRFNAPLFHSLAAASFLETAVPLHVNRLEPVLAANPDARTWLEQVWRPRRSKHGHRLREYVEAIWPELDWNAAYDEFCQAHRKRPANGGAHMSVALETLGVCVAEVQAAVFYRALAKGADDPSLRGLAREAASDHAEFFAFFRAIFEHAGMREGIGFGKSWRTLQAACRSARDFDVRTAIEPLARHWHGPRTMPELAYGEVVSRMVQLIQRHAALGRIEQFMFQAWLRPGPVPAVAPAFPVRQARPLPFARQLV